MLDELLLLNWKHLLYIVIAWIVAFLLHNLLYMLFSGIFGPEADEAFFFILTVFVIPLYFIASLGYTLVRKYSNWPINHRSAEGH